MAWQKRERLAEAQAKLEAFDQKYPREVSDGMQLTAEEFHEYVRLTVPDDQKVTHDTGI